MDENLEQKIIENRKQLKKEIKPSTIKMYISNIKKLSKLMNDGEEKGGIDWLKNIDKVKDKLTEKKENGKELHYSSVRNYMNSAIIYLYAMNNKGSTDDLIEKYSDYRDELNKQYEEEASAGTWSEKQGKNVITMEELHKVITDIGNELKTMKLKELDKLNARQRSLLQVYMILNIHSIIPMRNDLAGMKIIKKRVYNKLSEEEKKERNYLVLQKNDMFFCLNDYKTNRKYSEKCIPLPPELKKIMRFFLKFNNSDFLLTRNDGEPMSRNAISQVLIKTFKKRLGKSISTNLLRKIYLSHKYSDIKEEMQADADMMGHSVALQQKVYVKKEGGKSDEEEPVE
jgi:uncharacterized protein YjgD (DUF1641 family)